MSVFSYVLNSPGSQDCQGLESGDGAGIRPVYERAGGIGTKPIRARGDSNPAEVEAVGIPAGLKGGIARGEAVGVKAAGFEELLETAVVEVNE